MSPGLAPRRDRAYWALGALVAFTLLEFPHFAYDLDHDLGSHASFEYYLARGYQFGVELYQNVGPLGCLHYTYSYAGYLHPLKVVGKTLLRLALAAQLLWFGTHLRPRWLRYTPLLTVLAVLPVGDEGPGDFLDVNESYSYLSIYLGGLYLMSSRRGALGRAAAAATLLLLATLALTKHTSLMLAVATVGAATLHRALRRDWRGAAILPAGYAGLLLGLWVAARQHPLHLAPFLRGVFAFSGGYNESMALYEPLAWTVLGLLALALIAAAVVLGHTRGIQDAPRSLLAAFFAFVMWKHAYVRADVPHVTVLYAAVPVFVLLCAWAGSLEGTAPRSGRWTGVGVFALSLALSFAAFATVVPGCRYRLGRLTRHWAHNARWLASPSARTADMYTLLQESKARHRLPEIRERVGPATVDMFGFQPGHVLLNDLEYTPRPMPITFAATSELLARANEAFYRDRQRAPAYVLSAYAAIERRLASLDDGLALGALLDNYRPVLVENDILLLERKQEMRRERHRRLLLDQRVPLGRMVAVPDEPESLIWAEVDMEPSLRGRALSLLYKPPMAVLLLEIEPAPARVQAVRFITSAGASGFLLSPLVGGNGDLVALYQRAPLPRVRAFGLTCDGGDESLFRPAVRVRLFAAAPPRP